MTLVSFINMELNVASTLSVIGPQVLAWKDQGQFINDGAWQIGSATSPGSVLFSLYDLYASMPAALTNTGSMTLRNNSRFQTNVVLDNNDLFLNTAGAVLSINSGSVFDNPDQAALLGVASAYNSAKVTNNGLIAVNGAAGRTTKFYSQGNYSGSGLLSIRGAPGAAPTSTLAQIEYNGASGIFDVASGELAFTKSHSTGGTPLGGTVNFLDANSQLTLLDPKTSGDGDVVSATINGFQAGDRIVLVEYSQSNGLALIALIVEVGYKSSSLRESRQCGSPDV